MISIKILSSKVYYERWASLTEYQIQYKSDSLDTRVTRVAFNSGDGAAVFLYNPEENKVLLIKQFRYGAYFNSPEDAEMIEVCAGIIEEEEPETTAIRETLEETGCAIDTVNKVGEVYVSPGAHTEKVHLFTARYTDLSKVSRGGGSPEEHEDIQVVEMSYQELKNIYDQNAIRDAKTLILVQYWLLHLKDS